MNNSTRPTAAHTRAEVFALLDEAEAAAKGPDRAAAAVAFETLVDHPCTYHHSDLPGHLDDLARLYAAGQRFDDAIATKHKAIAAGLRGVPDPLADVAEWLIASGRRDDGDALYAELRAASPDDVWMYNSAMFAYRGIDDAEALRWALNGIDVAFRTGDPEQIITQLADFARDAWDALGEPPATGLLERVDAFVAAWNRPKRPRHVYEAPPQLPACSHCEFDPAATPPTWQAPLPSLDFDQPVPRPAVSAVMPSARPKVGPTAIAWFSTAEDWAKACRAWPDIAEALGTDHSSYSHHIESTIKAMSRDMPGHRFVIATLRFEDVEAELATLDGSDDLGGADPGSAARASAAAMAARERRSVPWPPGRNDRCWCRSGRKYKHCCAPVPPRPSA